MSAPHVLYRFYDDAGTLLYVGSTLNLQRRMVAHSRKSPWWPRVATSKFEHFPDRASVIRAEQAAIEGDHPAHNLYRAEGKTPLHSFRVSTELWNQARDLARENGETIADVLRRALERYVKRGEK